MIVKTFLRKTIFEPSPRAALGLLLAVPFEVMTDQFGRPIRYERESLEDLRTTLVGYGLNEDFVRGMVDMKWAKDNGLDGGVTRTPDTASPTTFGQWCAQTLKPAVVR